MAQDRENNQADRDDQKAWEREREKPEAGSDAGASAAEAGDSTGEWFVDFDVWEAALEAKFGPAFEQVLTGALGRDWVNQLNARMLNEQNFYKVLDDIKSRIAGQDSGETLEQLIIDEDRIGFEALGEGEVICDESMVDPEGGGEGGGRQRKLPNLADLRKKDFEAAGDQKSPRADKLDKPIIEADVTAADDEIVLMDRNDFSRMNYFARKELDRHKDDLETREVLERKSREEQRVPVSLVNRLILVVAALVMFYVIFCLIALPVGEYREDKLAAVYPAHYLFRPSTAMHKQGELSRVGDPGAGDGGTAISFYFLQPSFKRLELDHVLGGDRRRFHLDFYSGKELRIDDGPWGDTLEVRRIYSQNWPTNRSAILSEPYLSLSRNGQTVLQAFERSSSGLLPGLLVMDIVTGDGRNVGVGYAADNLFQINLTEPVRQGSAAEAEITMQLVFLFSLLEL